MFGLKKLTDGLNAVAGMSGDEGNAEAAGKKLGETILSFGRTNLIGGACVTAAGFGIGYFGAKLVKELRAKKKQNKELPEGSKD